MNAIKPELRDLAGDPSWLFDQLTKRIKTCKAPDAQLRVTAHIREKSGHGTIAAFHNNGATDAEKVEIYSECLKAVISNDFSRLKGSVPAGQAQSARPVEAKKEQETPTTPPDEAHKPTTIEAGAGHKRPTGGQPAGNRAEILEALAKLLQSDAPPPVSVDPDEVRAISREICESHLKEISKDLRGDIQERLDLSLKGIENAVAEHLKRIPPRDVVELRKWDGTVKEITGLRHKQLPLVIKSVTARTKSGWPVPCWWFGAPGAGKTHLWRMVAEAIGVQYYPVPLGPTTTEGKLLGYRNLATGDFVKGVLFDPYSKGGLVNLDEIDIADPSVLVGANAIASNEEFMFPSGEVVRRHPDFYLVASANTLGTGATGGFTRNKLDAATLDRFAKFRLEYDRDLEVALCGNAKWADFVWAVREYVEKNCSQSIYITPRASINGAALLANGIPVEAVADATLFAMMPKDIKATILSKIGQPKL